MEPEGKGENHRFDQGMDNVAFDHSENVRRKSSAISNNIDRFNKRDEQLKEARAIIERKAQDGKITSEQLGNLFKDTMEHFKTNSRVPQKKNNEKSEERSEMGFGR